MTCVRHRSKLLFYSYLNGTQSLHTLLSLLVTMLAEQEVQTRKYHHFRVCISGNKCTSQRPWLSGLMRWSFNILKWWLGREIEPHLRHGEMQAALDHNVIGRLQWKCKLVALWKQCTGEAQQESQEVPSCSHSEWFGCHVKRRAPCQGRAIPLARERPQPP